MIYTAAASSASTASARARKRLSHWAEERFFS